MSRALSHELCTSKDLWLQVKPTIRQVESDEGCLVFDDTLIEKPWRDENELSCWHYDHSKGRNVKGINRLNGLYHVNETSLPVAFERVGQPITFCDIKNRKHKRFSEVTKNELMRDRLNTAVGNALKFKWVLFDTWFSSTENMTPIKLALEKDFVGALKTNRLVALSEEDKAQGCFTRIDPLDWSEQEVKPGGLKGMSFPVRLVGQVFTNKDKHGHPVSGR